MKRLALLQTLNLLFMGLLLASPASPQDRPFTLSTSTDVVLVNVVVRDRSGAFIRDLKPEEFTITEDGRAQKLLSMDVENTDALLDANDLQAANLLGNLNAAAPNAPAEPQPAAELPKDSFRDRRLIVLFFDLSSMQPEEIGRAVNSAQEYVKQQMKPADLVAVVTLDNTLNVDQDFTTDREELTSVLNTLDPNSSTGFEETAAETAAAETDTETTSDTVTADDTEYNVFNTDRRLDALKNLAETLTGIDQKKSVIYFSSGMTRTGVDNQAQLRAATNAAIRANLSIYSIDVRGLQAVVPGGDLSRGGQRGTALFSGRGMRQSFDSNFQSQETLVALSNDTGGRAFLNANDFAPAFTRVQEDTAMYYVLGYSSTNVAKDGRFRRISVTVKRKDLRVEHRRGYYADTDFQHTSKQNREKQLQDELASDLSSTDLPVYLSTGYFRLADVRYFVPVSLVVPGSAIPFTRASDQDRATLDILGVVQDQRQQPFGTIRDTVKLEVSTTQDVKRKNVQYDAGFLLPPGRYQLKFILRENQSGQVGSFVTDVFVPNLRQAPVKISSVVASSQKQAAKQKKDNPFYRNGTELIPSVTHVFSRDQRLYLFYEVYEAARPSDADQKDKAAIRLLTNATFFKGNVKVYETPTMEVNQNNTPDRRTATVELEVPLSELQPGFYVCQVNVVDEAAGQFVFPRLALLVR